MKMNEIGKRTYSIYLFSRGMHSYVMLCLWIVSVSYGAAMCDAQCKCAVCVQCCCWCGAGARCVHAVLLLVRCGCAVCACTVRHNSTLAPCIVRC